MSANWDPPRKRYLSQGSASNVLLEPAGLAAKLSTGHRSVVYDYGEGVMGKFSRSWQLVMQSFAILRSDKQLMLFPVLSAVSCFVVTAMIATGGAFLRYAKQAVSVFSCAAQGRSQPPRRNFAAHSAASSRTHAEAVCPLRRSWFKPRNLLSGAKHPAIRVENFVWTTCCPAPIVCA